MTNQRWLMLVVLYIIYLICFVSIFSLAHPRMSICKDCPNYLEGEGEGKTYETVTSPYQIGVI